MIFINWKLRLWWPRKSQLLWKDHEHNIAEAEFAQAKKKEKMSGLYKRITGLCYIRHILSSSGILSFITHLYLTWPNVELLKNVDEKSLHFIPGVDGVGAVENNHYVHIGFTSWKKKWDLIMRDTWRKQMLANEELIPSCGFENRVGHDIFESLLWKAGAIVLENLKLALTLEHMPVL